MGNPIPAATACVGTALLIGLLTGAAQTVNVLEVPECTDFVDYITGCKNGASMFLAYGVLGTIPGAHDVVNLFMGVLGFAMRGTIIHDVFNWYRGRT